MNTINAINLIGNVAKVFSSLRIHASQISVLTTIASHQGCTLRTIADKTSLSDQHICRILRYLSGTGDIVAKASGHSRRYFLTSQAIRTLSLIVSKITSNNENKQ